ncbi:hypothetical protein ACJDU8_01835 [Clostridium sp. WILCCON 0269]|uniref:ABC transporter substrate-binding protein n=1 Tax=Candidatus Clostridium eludens TaxID=3381663 RepID=A0ABW8SEC2_9CLOT
MKKITVKISTIAIMLVFVLSLVACGAKHEAVKPDKSPKEVAVDKKHTEDLKKESGV